MSSLWLKALSDLVLCLHALDRDTIGKHDSLGIATLPLSNIFRNNIKVDEGYQCWLPLKSSTGKSLARGELRIHLQYGPHQEECKSKGRVKLLERYEQTLHHVKDSLMRTMQSREHAGESQHTMDMDFLKTQKQHRPSNDMLNKHGSELHRKIDELQEEQDTEQLPVTGKRFSILIHRGNQLLDPNYSAWITKKKGLHFTFVSTTSQSKTAIARLERINKKVNAYVIYHIMHKNDKDIVVGYIELYKPASMSEMNRLGKGMFAFTIRRKPRNEVRDSYLSRDSEELLHSDGEWSEEYNVRLYAVISMDGETRKTHMHRPFPTHDTISEEFKQEDINEEARRLNRANCSIFDKSKSYFDFLSEMDDLEDERQYGFSWGLGKAILLCDGVFGMALQEKEVSTLLPKVCGATIGS